MAGGYTIPLFGPNVLVNDWDIWREYWLKRTRTWKHSPEFLERVDKEYHEIFGKPNVKGQHDE